MAEDNKRFRTSNQSRKKTRRKKGRGGLWLLILIPLIIALGVALGLTVRYILDQHEAAKRRETQTESASAQGLPSIVDTVEEPSSCETTQPVISTEETLPVMSTEDTLPMTTEADTTEESTEAPTEPPQPGGSYTPTKSAQELLPIPGTIDRESDILSKGGWYGGKFVRDLNTGKVTCEWDREKAVIQLLKDYGAIYHKNEDQKVCYLTFDCGGTSSAENVGEILDTLKAKDVKAVFFIPGDFFLNALNREGESIDGECAAVMRRIVAEGHLIGSHTYTHPQMPKLSDEDFIAQLNTQQQRIDAALGYSYPLSYYRPPEGAISERDLYLAQKMGYHVTLWSYAYLDWDASKQMEVGEALTKAKVGLHDGCVYLLHALSSTNRAMLGDLIDYMKAEGYDIRRIDK